MQSAFILSGKQVPKNQQGRNILGDHAGSSHTVRSHMALNDEKEIQKYIQNAGYGQIKKGAGGLASGT